MERDIHNITNMVININEKKKNTKNGNTDFL